MIIPIIGNNTARIDVAEKLVINTDLARKILVSFIRDAVTKAGFHKAQKLFRQYSDKDYSLVDCASFATMQEKGLSTVFAFDEDFRHFGFQIMGTV